jgi:protein-L-isoaspartate(D-aspartate) O-methyltransferase
MARDAAGMIEDQLVRRGIQDPRVLDAMRTVPRERFVPTLLQPLAYADDALPIGHGQTISQPYVVALMTEALALQGDETVLEIGTGSGYQAALLSHLARQVYTIEVVEELAEAARQRFAELGYANIEVRIGDGSLGWPEYAPYEAIIVTAAAPNIPAPLLDQLADGGRLVIPIGRRWEQILVHLTRTGGQFHRLDLAPVAFVPLIGRHGWGDSGADNRQ